MEKNEKYFQAKNRARETTAFYQHLAVYVLVITLVFTVDLCDGGNWWCYYPATGWGIFVVLNALSIKSHGIFGNEWEERAIHQIMGSE